MRRTPDLTACRLGAGGRGAGALAIGDAEVLRSREGGSAVSRHTCIALGMAAILIATVRGEAVEAQCQGDFDRDGTVAINEIITAVNNSLVGCPPRGTRFVDAGDGTISDLQTGLMWEKKIALDSMPNLADLHDADNRYSWSWLCAESSRYCQPTATAETVCAAGAQGDPDTCRQCPGDEGACAAPPACTGDGRVCSANDTVWMWLAALNTSRFAGYDDWRLPTASELQGLVDYAQGTPPMIDAVFHGPGCGGTCTDLASPACSCAQSDGYWSASVYAAQPGYGWTVAFGTGSVLSVGSTVSWNARHGSQYLRAVRGGS